MWETLENRVLLSASLASGILTVNGTDKDDDITTRISGSSLIVFFNGAETKFKAASVSKLVINGKGGDDYIINGAASVPAKLNGGAGDDYLSGGNEDDTLLGGDGNDKLYGQGGNDSLDGGDGNDVLNGGIGDDTIVSRDANKDTVIGGGGDDSVLSDNPMDSISGVEQTN